MAGGPLYPSSVYYVDPPDVGPGVFVGAGANSKHELGYRVAASISADKTIRMRFDLPPQLPSGTGKLRLLAQAAATSGDAKLNPKWASVAAEEDPSSAALNAEGTQTITWSAGDSGVYKDLRVFLDADVLVAGEVVVMDLVFETTNWTLAVDSVWRAMLIWE